MAQSTQIPGIVESEDSPFEEFYRPSKNLTTRICDRIDSIEEEAIKGIEVKDKSEMEESGVNYDEDLPPGPDSNEETIIQQRLIAEEMDGCLLDAAQSSA